VKDIVILGGPNGAGKTTAAQVLVPQRLEIREFVNADEIARGLSHGVPENVVVRRYWAGLASMRRNYLPLVGVAAIYDNSDEGRTLIAERTPDADLVVHDANRWAIINKAIP
jgi:predicted ABC-type ATPase